MHSEGNADTNCYSDSCSNSHYCLHRYAYTRANIYANINFYTDSNTYSRATYTYTDSHSIGANHCP